MPSGMVRRLCIYAAAFAFMVVAPLPVHAHQDAQYWSSVGFDVKLCKKLKLSLGGELRFGNEMGTLYWASPDATLAYGFHEWFS
ncbi:MAG TPA: hypothetical protein PLZ86_09935, partial [bacterium]|nr:hypothetical protein [bacterium]